MTKTPPDSTHRFDPSHLNRLGGSVPLRLVSRFVQVPDEPLLVALMLETGLMMTAGLCRVSGMPCRDTGQVATVPLEHRVLHEGTRLVSSDSRTEGGSHVLVHHP
jgi:hypothetical protein